MRYLDADGILLDPDVGTQVREDTYFTEQDMLTTLSVLSSLQLDVLIFGAIDGELWELNRQETGSESR